MKVAEFPYTRDWVSITRKGPSRRDFTKVAHHFSGGLTFFGASVPEGRWKCLRIDLRRDARKKTVIDRP